MTNRSDTLRALQVAWECIQLVPGSMEANFSRLMATTVGQHHYDTERMHAVIVGLLSGFQIDCGDTGEVVEVAPDNLKMSIFLLWLAFDEAEGNGISLEPGQGLQFRVTAKMYEKARRFFDVTVCNDACNPALTNHQNLRRFFTRGAIVTIYLADEAE